MREILFRGKRIDNGKWVQGDLYQDKLDENATTTYIIEFAPTRRFTHTVDPTTIGQFTGLTDKNGTKIFEGDIVDYFTEEWGGVAEIKYVHGGFIVRNDFCFELISQANGKLEVIGNIHEEVQE